MRVPVKHRVMPFDQGWNAEDWLGMSFTGKVEE